MRVGIHSGPALTSDGDWYGRTVNVAARVCAVAGGDEVMVSETARAAAGQLDWVEWGARELHWLRNVPEPVGTYVALACEERDRPCPGCERGAGPCRRTDVDARVFERRGGKARA